MLIAGAANTKRRARRPLDRLSRCFSLPAWNICSRFFAYTAEPACALVTQLE